MNIVPIRKVKNLSCIVGISRETGEPVILKTADNCRELLPLVGKVSAEKYSHVAVTRGMIVARPPVPIGEPVITKLPVHAPAENPPVEVSQESTETPETPATESPVETATEPPVEKPTLKARLAEIDGPAKPRKTGDLVKK